MNFRTIASILVISATLSTYSQASPARNQEVAIRELLNLTGSGKLGVQVINQMLPSLKKIGPEIGNEFWDKFEASVNSDDLVEMVIPIYAKHFSLDEIEQVIAFYKTPVGQKFIKEQPAILQESMLVGQEWGQSIAKRAFEQIQAEKAKQLNTQTP